MPLGSSIFVRVDEDRYDVLVALIIGPEGTPYENGCFEFDIFLPAEYPQVNIVLLLVFFYIPSLFFVFIFRFF